MYKLLDTLDGIENHRAQLKAYGKQLFVSVFVFPLPTTLLFLYLSYYYSYVSPEGRGALALILLLTLLLGAFLSYLLWRLQLLWADYNTGRVTKHAVQIIDKVETIDTRRICPKYQLTFSENSSGVAIWECAPALFEELDASDELLLVVGEQSKTVLGIERLHRA